MATVIKTLAALNAVVELDVPTDVAAAVALQYPAGGTGTIVVEATINGQDWVALKLKNANTAADVDNLAAAGIAWAEVPAYEKVRARMSVAGSCQVALSIATS